MKMIKLENGNLINLSAVSYISKTEMVAYFKKPVIKSEGDFQTYKCYGVGVTEADIERIAASTVNKEVKRDEN
jgi:hypothetical protein